MEFEVVGKDKVAQYIALSKTKKFIISKYGSQKHAIPIFEHLEEGSNEKSIHAFLQWAEITDNDVCYILRVFNSVEDSIETGEELRNKKSGKQLEIRFRLNKKAEFERQQTQSPQIDVSLAIENAIMKMQQKNADSEILRKLAEMDEKINAIEEGDDDFEDAELNGVGNPNITALINILAPLINGKKNTASVINGITPEKIKNINTAIKILSKYDDQIDTDLLKLSSIAEKNPATFNMLINSLRTM
jgi:hypothetical protein